MARIITTQPLHGVSMERSYALKDRLCAGAAVQWLRDDGSISKASVEELAAVDSSQAYLSFLLLQVLGPSLETRRTRLLCGLPVEPTKDMLLVPYWKVAHKLNIWIDEPRCSARSSDSEG